MTQQPSKIGENVLLYKKACIQKHIILSKNKTQFTTTFLGDDNQNEH